MLKYSRYLFINIFSKKSFWITLFASLLVITILGVLGIRNENFHDRSVVDVLTSFNKFLPFLFTTLLTSLLVIYIFKNGEEDGSELLIVSKPIYRRQVILGKFFVLITMIVAVELIFFLDTLAYIQADELGLPAEKFRFAGSLAVGGLIIQLIIASFLMLIALISGRVALLAIGIIGAAIIPISSMIISPASGGTPRFRLPEIRKHIKLKVAVTSSVDELVENIYKNKDSIPASKTEDDYSNFFHDMGVTKARTTQDVSFIPSTGDKAAQAYKDEMWYDKAMYFDMWYQWSGFYDIIMGENYVDSNKIQKWVNSVETVNYDKKYAIDPTGKWVLGDGTHLDEVFITSDMSSLSEKNFDMEKVINTVERVKDHSSNIYKMFHAASYTDASGNKIDSLEARIKVLSAIIGSHNDMYIGYAPQVMLKLIRKEMGADYVPAQKLWRHEDASGNKNVAYYEKHDSFLSQTGDKVEVWKAVPFVKRSTKVYIWIAIASAMLAATVFLYWRKDFK